MGKRERGSQGGERIAKAGEQKRACRRKRGGDNRK